MFCRRIIILFLVALLWPAAAQAQDWEWAEGRTISRIQWDGLARLNERQVLDKIVLRQGAEFSSRRLSLDIAALYRSGWFGSTETGVPPVSAEIKPFEDTVIVIFRLHERQRVSQFYIEKPGDVIEQDDLDRLVTTRTGAPFDTFKIEREARAVRDALREKGFALAEVTHREEKTELGVNVWLTIRPGPEVHVDEIIYQGAEQLDPSDLEDATGPDAPETKARQFFGLLEAGIYRRKAFLRDLDKISRWYRSQGFLDARVYLVEERFSLQGDKLTLIVGVEEGVRYTVRRVGVEGTRILDGDMIAQQLSLKPGRPFLGQHLHESIEKIRHLYGQRAHVHARVDVDVRYDMEHHLLDVSMRVDEGPKVRIDRIRVVGNAKTMEKVIRRELSFYPGEYFNSDEVQASLGRLGRLRYFKDVRIDFEPGSAPGRENVILRVEEARTGSFVLGGGVSTASGFFGNISLQQRNFDITDLPTSWRDFIEGRSLTGAGQSMTISIQPGRERSQYSIEFIEPYFLDFPLELSIEAALRDRQREQWLESRRSLRLGFGYRITQDLIFRTSYRIERVKVRKIEFDAPPDVVEVRGVNYVSGLRFSLSLNRNLVDRDFVTYGGYAGSVYYELVGKFLGGDHDFQRAGAEANWQHSFFAFPGTHKWVLTLRSSLDWQAPFGNDPIPIFERFFAGGPGSIRGFRFRTVGPRDDLQRRIRRSRSQTASITTPINFDDLGGFPTDEPVGGDFRVLGTAEFSFPLFMNVVRGVVFTDAGFVANRQRDARWKDFRIALGFGFRVRIPLFPAPVALDFAWPIQKKSGDEEQVFSFAVGFGF